MFLNLLVNQTTICYSFLFNVYRNCINRNMFEKQVLSRQFADSLEKVGTEFWAWRMSNSREFSTSLGQYKYNDLLDSYSYQKLVENKVALFSFTM